LWHFKNKNAAMAQFGKLMAQADSFDPLPFDNEELDVQYEIYQCVWQEAEELRASGKLLEQGKKAHMQAGKIMRIEDLRAG